MDLPPSLKSLRPYLQHAKQVGNFEPLIAYYCRYYAVQLGTEILSQDSSPDVKNTVITLLDKLEQEKRQLIERLRDPENGAPYVTNFALQIFDKADTEDQEGKATKSVISSH